MKTRIALVAAALLLTLTGCSAAPANAGGERTAPTVTESAAPLVAETTEPVAESPHAAYLDGVRALLPEDTQIPNATDEQLVAAGEAACERLAAGEPSDAISVIDGETPNGIGYFNDSGMIVSAARTHLCG